MALRDVTKKEYEDFLKNYPRNLKVDVCGIREPALKTYYDLGRVVAQDADDEPSWYKIDDSYIDGKEA